VISTLVSVTVRAVGPIVAKTASYAAEQLVLSNKSQSGLTPADMLDWYHRGAQAQAGKHEAFEAGRQFERGLRDSVVLPVIGSDDVPADAVAGVSLADVGPELATALVGNAMGLGKLLVGVPFATVNAVTQSFRG